jgi:deazaflavin-dependent oxidoreductase (nitroreductase family)
MSEEGARLFGDEHVRRYRETGGEIGHIWKEGATTLLLTTTGRKSGEPRTTPLIYARDGDRFVIVASQGGAPEHPNWYENLSRDPEVEVQVLDDVFQAHAHTAEGEERERLWIRANEVWPHYDEYKERTSRTIPVVVLERAA